ncbi:Sperm-associated antigen 16 protein [Schistosoma japonicum]|nr:Sperm-associated antigen 16 protein [Schistosoma japonicum]
MEIDHSKYYLEEEQIPEDDHLSSIVSVNIEDLPSPSKDDELDPLILRVEETTGDSLAKEKCETLTAPNLQFSHPSVDQFLRNYLQENGFLETLNIFQAEWFKFLHKGLLNAEGSPVADIYLQNSELRNIIKDIRSENQDLKNSVLKLDDEVRKIKNERDYHMIKHRQTLQEKEKLLCDIKRVKEHYAEYEPILRLLRQKYETAVKEKTLHRIERDRAMNQVEGLRHALTSLQKLGITSNDSNDVDNFNMDQTMPEKNIANVTTRQSNMEIDQKCKKNFMKTDEFNLNSKLGKSVKRNGFCDLPVDRKVNPLLAKLTNHSYKFTRLDNRKLDMSIHAHDATIWKIFLTDDKMTEQNHCKRIGLLRQHAGAVWSINWHWTGTYLASSGMDNTIRLWNVEYAIMSYKMNRNLLSTHSTTSYCTILRGHSKSVNSVQFLPYGNILVTGSSDKTGLCEHTFLGHTHSINNAIFNQQGLQVISCDSGGYIRLWDLRKMEKFSFEINLPTITTKIHQNLMTTSTISVNSNNDVENKNFPICFDLNKTRKIDRFNRHLHAPPRPVNQHQNASILQYGQRNRMGVNQLAIDLSSEYIVAGCDDAKIYCIEISTGQISTLQGHDDSIQSIVLDYVTGYLYSSSADQKICSWI